MASDINPTLTPTKSLTNFRFWCQKVLPLVYDDSLSYYEVLGKMVAQLNDVIDDVNADIENVDTLKDAFLALQTYVNEFFDDIDQLASYAERAEDAQTAANASAINAASSATNASASSLAAMNARDAAVTARQVAETSANTATTASENATTKASEAAQSAITAQTAQASATQSATLAATDRSAAQTAANTASIKANEANTSATNAADSAAEAVAAVDTVVNGLGNITKTIENVPIATTEDALASLAKKLVIDIEPAQSGIGEPSPDNVQPITGHTSAKVVRTGKNLLSTNARYWNYNIATDGTIITENSRIITDYIPCNQNDMFSASQREYNFYYVAIIAFDKNKNILGRNDGNNLQTITYSVPENTRYIRFQLQYASVSDAVTPSIWAIAKTQLEKNPVATEYEPLSGETYDITFPSEAGTVYGGTLTNVGEEWKLVVNMEIHTYNGTENWGINPAGVFNRNLDGSAQGLAKKGKCNILPIQSAYSPTTKGILLGGSATDTYMYVCGFQNEITTVEDFKTFLSSHNMVVCYPIATPTEYTLTETQALTLLNGINNVWADTGNINTLEYFTNAENYVTTQIDLAKALIAPILKDMIADTALFANDFRIVGNTLYRITGNVASGGTLTPNTNCVATTVGAILKSLLSA